MNCIYNLRQAGLGFRMWSNDHGDKFPWDVAEKEGGTKECAVSPDVYRHFLIASNEMNSPKILYCPQDVRRKRVGYWNIFTNQNLSYFVGLNADETKPTSILSGDRTITTNGAITQRLLSLNSTQGVSWAKGVHTNVGNIGFGDGSVQQFTTAQLQKFLAEKAELPTRLSLP